MRILVFGGTTEGEKIAIKLAEAGAKVSVSVATEYGSECQVRHEGLTVIEGRQDADQIEAMVENFDLCIDATHPYAEIATANIKTGCERAGIKVLRFVRPEGSLENSDYKMVASAQEAAEVLASTSGNVFLTTGAKELGKYSDLDSSRLFPRVLPLETSLKSCSQAGIPARNIIAMQGPFTESMNIATIEQYHIDIMVTKNSGSVGGFEEKLKSARNAGVKLIVIGRPTDEEGFSSVDEIVREAMEVCNG